jgi:hypothetical protein
MNFSLAGWARAALGPHSPVAVRADARGLLTCNLLKEPSQRLSSLSLRAAINDAEGRKGLIASYPRDRRSCNYLLSDNASP